MKLPNCEEKDCGVMLQFFSSNTLFGEISTRRKSAHDCVSLASPQSNSSKFPATFSSARVFWYKETGFFSPWTKWTFSSSLIYLFPILIIYFLKFSFLFPNTMWQYLRLLILNYLFWMLHHDNFLLFQHSPLLVDSDLPSGDHLITILFIIF